MAENAPGYAALGLLRHVAECLRRVSFGVNYGHNLGDGVRRTPLYEAIVLKARAEELAGATVLRGLMGFGKHSILHTAKILRLSEDLPMIVEIES